MYSLGLRFLRKLRLRLEDGFRYHRGVRDLGARWKLLFGHSRPEILGACYARAERPATLERIRHRMDSLFEGPNDVEFWKAATTTPAETEVSRTLLLKAPGPDAERGVILSYFEYNWNRLLHGIADFESFSREYTLVLLPSWSPTNYGVLGNLLARTPSELPVYLQPANLSEIPKLEAFDSRIRIVPGLACDWVHPDRFSPLPWADRDIDLLLVSNWARFKRHWEFFSALRELPRDLRVVCVGQPDSGRTLDDIRRQQRQLGAPQEIEYLESLPIETVNELQCRAKVAPIFSRWEGGCVAAVETLLAGAVLAMREDAHIGARAHVNEDTGVLFRASNVAQKLSWALENGHLLRPRRYALEHCASPITSQRLNSYLREESLEMGIPWTRDLAPMCYHPYLTFENPSDRSRLDACSRDLHRRYPEVFPPGWLDKACR